MRSVLAGCAVMAAASAVWTTLNFFVAPMVAPQLAVLSSTTMTVGNPADDACDAE
jgi:hypothetical protein